MGERVLIIYYSRTGNTEKLAEKIKDGAEDKGAEVVLKKVQNTEVEELLDVDAVVIGSPVYYGGMACEIKKFLDESVRLHGRLDGKVGAAFATSGNIAGGNETTIIGILQALLIHGMIVQGDPEGDHYGPVAVGTTNKFSLEEGYRLGQRVVDLIRRIK